jgi:oligoendopeptidase F
VDEFQHRVYSEPDMTPEQRKEVWLELEAKYRPYISYEGIPYLEQGTRWQYQMHIFESPFYYIDYCLAQVVALEFLSDSLEDYGGALARYMAHAARGGKYAFNTLVKMAGLASPFQEGALAHMVENVSKKLDELFDGGDK